MPTYFRPIKAGLLTLYQIQATDGLVTLTYGQVAAGLLCSTSIVVAVTQSLLQQKVIVAACMKEPMNDYNYIAGMYASSRHGLQVD